MALDLREKQQMQWAMSKLADAVVKAKSVQDETATLAADLEADLVELSNGTNIGSAGRQAVAEAAKEFRQKLLAEGEAAYTAVVREAVEEFHKQVSELPVLRRLTHPIVNTP